MDNKDISEQEINVVRKTVRSTQEIKTRCRACYPCPMGVTGCDVDSKPHGHGCARRCPECGVPYAYVHPHSNVCSMGTPIDTGVMHDEDNLRMQLEWKKEIC